ncbi:type IV pilin protein [Candidatus Avelusimicrobium caledoniensis]|uniref:type IV pilin protein n=1 Tax=Candidatus Avelusimicrobium caledoniensis TaxID=3416220 RepID=UPI003D1165BD
MENKSSLLGCLNQIKMSFPKFVVGNLPLSKLLLKEEKQRFFNGKVEDPRQKHSGMTPSLMGFTLIELLVVVLIIGILAAVALPQYQKAVEKSKATQAITLLKSVYQAAEAYQLANGNWPDSFDELSVDIPWTGTVAAINGYPALSNEEWSLQLYRTNNETYIGLVITRLSGKYTGGQFQIWKKHESTTISRDTLLCGENKSGTYAMADNVSYCTKLFQGTTKLADGSGGRVYTFMQ